MKILMSMPTLMFTVLVVIWAIINMHTVTTISRLIKKSWQDIVPVDHQVTVSLCNRALDKFLLKKVHHRTNEAKTEHRPTERVVAARASDNKAREKTMPRRSYK
jgi:hypothetical protein